MSRGWIKGPGIHEGFVLRETWYDGMGGGGGGGDVVTAQGKQQSIATKENNNQLQP
jgi:hypothetical protein